MVLFILLNTISRVGYECYTQYKNMDKMCLTPNIISDKL